jgi:hypothetical protein
MWFIFRPPDRPLPRESDPEFRGVHHALAIRRERSLTLAMKSQSFALSMVASKPLARRRLRLSRAILRSMTRRRGQKLETCGGVGTSDDLEAPAAEFGEGLPELAADAGGICEDVAQPGKTRRPW